MSVAQRVIDLPGVSVKIEGEPGSGGGRVSSEVKNDGLRYPEAIALDVMESVLLALHARGVLTREVEQAVKDAHEAVGNNMHQLGQRALSDRQSSAYALFAHERVLTDDLQFDERMVVSGGDGPGAFVSSWTWVPDYEVVSHFESLIKKKHGSLDVLERFGIESLESAVEAEGLEAVYERIKDLIHAQDQMMPGHRERMGG